jgi:hypothetical protein
MNIRLFYILLSALLSKQVIAAESPTTPFNLIGYIQSFKLCDPKFNDATCKKNDARAAATMKVNGITVIIPENLKIIMPGTYLTAQDIFKGPKGTANGGLSAPEQSGLALEDQHPAGKPYIPFTAEIAGNIAKTANTPNAKVEYIAGLVNISQGVLQTSAGYIHDIDFAKGELHITPDPANTANLVRVRLNDPDDDSGSGRFGKSPVDPNNDDRFKVDQDNPTVHAMTGYPVCIPATAAGNDRCPMSNRMKDGSGNFLQRYTIGSKQAENVNRVPVANAPLCSGCDSTKLVPLVPGDYVIFSGIWMDEPDTATNTTGYISAYALEANLGIYTSPGENPVYVAIEESLWGTGGIPFPNLPQETGPGKPAPTSPPGENLVTRFRIVGFSTDPSRVVELLALDIDKDSGAETPRLLATVSPEVNSPLGRFEETVDQSIFLPPTREIRAHVKDAPSGEKNVVGIEWGQYTAPIGEYIFPEGRNFGFPQVPMNFENLCFLAKGAGPLDTLGRDKTPGAGCTGNNCTLGQLMPWPESGHGVTDPRTACNM